MTLDFGSVDSPGTVKALNRLAKELESEELKPQPVPQTSAEKRLLWLIRDLVLQSCTSWPKDARLKYDDPTPVFSGFIAVHAEAIALLAEYGVVIESTDNGGRVVEGIVLNQWETSKVLKTGTFREKTGD